MDMILVRTPACPLCGEATNVAVNAKGYRRWISGALIQNAFPELSLSERELLQTGYHSSCWDKEFEES